MAAIAVDLFSGSLIVACDHSHQRDTVLVSELPLDGCLHAVAASNALSGELPSLPTSLPHPEDQKEPAVLLCTPHAPNSPAPNQDDMATLGGRISEYLRFDICE